MTIRYYNKNFSRAVEVNDVSFFITLGNDFTYVKYSGEETTLPLNLICGIEIIDDLIEVEKC